MQTIIIENGKDKVDVFYQQDIDSLKNQSLLLIIRFFKINN